MEHKIKCQCGQTEGKINLKGIFSNIICYCKDCQEFAKKLNKENTLDNQGGSQIIQMPQSNIHFTKGIENITYLKLSEKGLIRWYTKCCKTPLGNTLSNPKISFISLSVEVLNKNKIENDFGKIICLANTKSAKLDKNQNLPQKKGITKIIYRATKIIISEYISGDYKKSEFARLL